MAMKKYLRTTIEDMARACHERAYAERGERYATPEEMEMHRSDPLACDEMVIGEIAAFLNLTREDGRGFSYREDGVSYIAWVNHWED